MTEKNLSGKVALITGGSRGIGKATTELFVRGSASIAINSGTEKRI